MTDREEVAGFDLDALVDEKVFGHSIAWRKNFAWRTDIISEIQARAPGFDLVSQSRILGAWVPQYSSRIADAWLVVEAMARLEPHPWMLTLMNWNYYGDRTVSARFTTHALGPEPVEEIAPTAPEAICRAALSAQSILSGSSNLQRVKN